MNGHSGHFTPCLVSIPDLKRPLDPVLPENNAVLGSVCSYQAGS